jgi:hypothetical protein
VAPGWSDGLMVPEIRAQHGRIGTSEAGIKRPRGSMKNVAWGMDFVQDRTARGRSGRVCGRTLCEPLERPPGA